MSEQRKSEILATKSLSSGQVQQGDGSSSGDVSSSKDSSISRKETRLSPPPMKQRCITGESFLLKYYSVSLLSHVPLSKTIHIHIFNSPKSILFLALIGKKLAKKTVRSSHYK